MESIRVKQSVQFNIDVKDVPKDIQFVIVQLHTYIHEMSMSNETNSFKNPKRTVTGSNVGLLQDTNGKTIAKMYAKNSNAFEVLALIAVTAYKSLSKSIFPYHFNI